MTHIYGYIATLFITIAYLPQLVLTIETKRCDMATATLLLLLVAMIFWCIHAITMNDIPLLISSGFSLIQMVFMSYYKFKNS